MSVDSTNLLSKRLQCPELATNSSNNELSEYVAIVDWIASVDATNGYTETAVLYMCSHQIYDDMTAQEVDYVIDKSELPDRKKLARKTYSEECTDSELI